MQSFAVIPKAVVRRCSSKKVFIRILQNSPKNTCLGFFFNANPTQVFSCESCETVKIFCITSPMAASVIQTVMFNIRGNNEPSVNQIKNPSKVSEAATRGVL